MRLNGYIENISLVYRIFSQTSIDMNSNFIDRLFHHKQKISRISQICQMFRCIKYVSFTFFVTSFLFNNDN